MTTDEAIERARENGYDGTLLIDGVPGDFRYLLDPKFWKSLGKAMKWDYGYEVDGIGGVHVSVCCGSKIDMVCNHKHCLCCGRMEWEGIETREPWLHHWHRLIDHLADGGTIDSFFEKL